MLYEKPKRGPYANSRVNPHEPNELKYWCRQLACTEAQLMHAVRAVGTSADAVRRFLKGKK
jgi:transposase